jgi:hypothetical protein
MRDVMLIRDFMMFNREVPVLGGQFTVEAGAPGIGRTTYEIKRFNGKWLQYKMVKSTVRELSPEECI